MKILITGKGKSGSWQVRGVQIGAQIGATVKPNATRADMRAHDVVVLVKRPTGQLLADMRASGTRIVHDIVDAWKQPEGNGWSETQAKHWLGTIIRQVSADGIICATKQMELDTPHECKTTIYHHANPALDPMNRCVQIHSVGYEGGRHYLGRYEDGLFEQTVRTRRFWSIDLDTIEYASIAIALRDCAGYAARHWKSNQKLANAQALGIPALCSPESGYQETSTGGVLWINSPDDLRAAFDKLNDPEHYAKVCAAVDKPPTLADIGKQYVAFLETVVNA